MVFERGSSTARMRAAHASGANPPSVTRIAVGWWAKIVDTRSPAHVRRALPAGACTPPKRPAPPARPPPGRRRAARQPWPPTALARLWAPASEGSRGLSCAPARLTLMNRRRSIGLAGLPAGRLPPNHSTGVQQPRARTVSATAPRQHSRRSGRISRQDCAPNDEIAVSIAARSRRCLHDRTQDCSGSRWFGR
jgi:hypothetical protein